MYANVVMRIILLLSPYVSSLVWLLQLFSPRVSYTTND